MGEITGRPDRDPARSRVVPGRGRAWVILTLALVIHALDEFQFDFVGEYNAALAQLHGRWEWLPLRPLDSTALIVLLLVSTAVLLALTPLVRPDRSWARLVSLNYALIMAANGLGHLVFSLAAGRVLAGAGTSILMVGAGLWLLSVELRQRPRHPTSVADTAAVGGR